MNKTQKIILAALNAILDGASDFSDSEMVFQGISKKEYDAAYYSRYDGKWPVLQKDTYVLKSAMDAIFETYDSDELMDVVAVKFQGIGYTYIECDRAYRRMGFHRLINRVGK